MRAKFRILFYLPSLEGGGAEMANLTLIRCLLARGHAIDLVLDRPGGELVAKTPVGTHVIILHARRSLFSSPKLARCLKARTPEIVISSLPHNNISAIISRAMSGVPATLIVWQHASLQAEAAVRNRFRLMLPLVRLLFPYADAIVANSAGVLEEIRQLSGSSRNLEVIYNPIDVSEADETCASVEAVHPWLKDPRLATIIGAGRLVKEKNFETLIEAFAMLPDPTTRLIIMGHGVERSRLQRQIELLQLENRAFLAGFVGDPFCWFRRARAVVLSSRTEGFGNVLVEAMACGVPVVSTDCPWGPREILSEGRYGHLVPVGDAPAMADAIMETLNNPRSSSCLKERAREFSMDNAADRFEDLFGRLRGQCD